MVDLAQVRQFLEAISDDRLHALWRVALLRGLRRGELLALRWADVDLDARTLHVRAGKTKSSKRTVSLDAGTVIPTPWLMPICALFYRSCSRR